MTALHDTKQVIKESAAYLTFDEEEYVKPDAEMHFYNVVSLYTA